MMVLGAVIISTLLGSTLIVFAAVPSKSTTGMVAFDADKIWLQLKDAEREVAELKGVGWFPDLPKKSNIVYQNAIQGLATVDSCFCSSNEVYFVPCTNEQISAQHCSNRTSESYAWGMARNEDRVFWGTVANEQCLETPGDYQDPSGIYCSGNPDLNWKIPSVYMYDVPADRYRLISTSLTGEDFIRLNNTVGLRAAGIKNGVAVLAGFSRDMAHVYMFGFSAHTGEFLASMDFIYSNDVRKFTYDISHDMYVGVGKIDGTGDIYRYTGSLKNPLSFELIGNVPGSPAELSFYNGRLLVATWAASLYLEDLSNYHPPFMTLSPLPADEMPAIATTEISQRQPDEFQHFENNVLKWTTIWAIDQYEPDPIVQYSYGISVNMQIGEWLYWGTVQYPVGAIKLIQDSYPENDVDMVTGQKATHRALALFRGRFLDTSAPEIELLYGDIVMPVYQPESNSWAWQENSCPDGSKIPRFGRAGFGNVYNMYLWSMNWINGYLLIGTFDSFGITVFSYLAPEMPTNLGYGFPVMGSDMYLMKVDSDGSISEAEMLTLGGFDNPSNFGFRNIVVDQHNSSESNVFIGTANIYNVNPRGGWELFKMAFPGLK